MCTVVVALNQRPGCPLIVATNRDESRERPFTDPERWAGPIAFTAGRDERAGGTWMGLNERGLFVALTNLWTGAPPEPDRRSRGELVTSLLRRPDLESARALLESTDPAEYNPCLLVCADASGAGILARPGPARFQSAALGAGVHVIGNVLPGATGSDKLERVAADTRALDLAGAGEDALFEGLRAVMASHTGERRPHESVCVHWDARDYGTVCTSLMLIGARTRWLYTRGAPCVRALDASPPAAFASASGPRTSTGSWSQINC